MPDNNVNENMLERGLKILEFLARKGGASFSEINEMLGFISHATQIRIIRQLSKSGYVTHDSLTGLYQPGPRQHLLAPPSLYEERTYFIQYFLPLMEELYQTYHITVILQYYTDKILICVHRICDDTTAVMQPPGFINTDPTEPWCLIRDAYTLSLDSLQGINPERSRQLAIIRSQQYYYDEGKLRPNFNRIGFPIFSLDHKFIGCLGVGGSSLEINASTIPSIIHHVHQYLKNHPFSTPSSFGREVGLTN